MRIELFILLVTTVVVGNIYTDGYYYKYIMSQKKLLQISGVVFGGLALYMLLKKTPNNAYQLIDKTNEYLKYLPIDQNTTDIINPILDLTKNNYFRSNNNLATHNSDQNTPIVGTYTNPIQRVKRSVSNARKKFVAARQKWKCNDCKQLLEAWFDVDHVLSLERGGNNEVDNLVALCKGCHGRKTTIDNL